MSDTSKFGFSPEILSLPNQVEYDGQAFPLAVEVKAGDLKQACGWIAQNAEQIERQAATHGAVLLRGLPLGMPDDFDATVTAFGLPNFTYEDSLSNAVRIVYTPRVFSANEAPP
ncbi:MAG: SyrP protein, partial [Opitutae bacterium]|nr:SyrP protein [Opitutae bacterium]